MDDYCGFGWQKKFFLHPALILGYLFALYVLKGDLLGGLLLACRGEWGIDFEAGFFIIQYLKENSIMATVGNTQITPSTWNGTYPLSDLPSGDLWYGPYVIGSAEYWECIGFARMVLDATYGSGNSISYASFTTADSVKTAFSSIPLGSRVTFNRVNNLGKHGIIVAGKSSTGITIYDCNWTANDKISYRTWTWSTLLSKYSSISSGVKPA